MTSPGTRPHAPAARARAAGLACVLASAAALAFAWPAPAFSGPVDEAPDPPATPTDPSIPAPSNDGGEDPPAADPPAEGSQDTSPRRLRPFPVVVVAGRRRGRVTHVTDLVVRGPEDARVGVRCRGEACPLRSTAARIGANGRVRLRRAQRAYRAGTVLEIRVTKPGRIGKYTRVRFRRGTPARTDSCLQPGERAPSACPGQ